MPMLKVLQTNNCIHDCRYCVNSCKDGPRASFEPEELAWVFENFLKRGYVRGLFLSSAVSGDPDLASERMIETAELIRGKMGFRGYVHLKVLPGTSRSNVERVCSLANRVSINMEAPSRTRLSELSSTKEFKNDILRRMGWLGEMKRTGRLANFTTQFVVGANGESDMEYLSGCVRLYGGFGLWRPYFSLFKPVKGTALQGSTQGNPLREHALYQADWLLRAYGFRLEELRDIANDDGLLPLGRDLKLECAKRNGHAFPVDINSAKYGELLRVPGIGPVSAGRIVRARNEGRGIGEAAELRKMGVVLRRAEGFVEIGSSGRQSRLVEY
jgi:predicted DNA-binding helix-hairpin-helix protein